MHASRRLGAGKAQRCPVPSERYRSGQAHLRSRCPDQDPAGTVVPAWPWRRSRDVVLARGRVEGLTPLVPALSCGTLAMEGQTSHGKEWSGHEAATAG
jgi:hypothetical protein